MEFLTKTKAIKLRSHLYKYLIADFDQETVRQTRHGTSRKAVIWFVELVGGKSHVIRLRNCYGKYLAASDLPFLLGVTGKKILQTVPEDTKDNCRMEWEPIRDGSQVKFKSWCGNFLRANGGAPPWRNAVTHDEPPTGSTQKWIFWDIEAVEVPENDSLVDYLSSMSSFSTVPDDVLVAISGEYNSPKRASQLSIIPAARTPRLTLAKSMFPRLFSSPNIKVCFSFL